MGLRWHRLPALALLLAALAASHPEPAAALPFAGTLTLRNFGGFGQFQEEITGSGEAAVAPGGAVTLPASAFATTRTDPVPCCNARPLVTIVLGTPAANRSGTLASGQGPRGGFGGSLPLTGFIKLGLFGPPAIAFVNVPLLVGRVGSTSGISPPGIRVSVTGTEWTTGAVTLSIPAFGTRPVTQMVSGADLRTPGGLGQLLLVSPTLVQTNIAGAESFFLDARLDLRFVPEPGTSLLLGIGLTGLVWARCSAGRPSPAAPPSPTRRAT